MQHSLSEMLLLDNELYLEAVQHKKISIKSLGLQEVHYGFNSSRNTSGRKSLKAVIPSEDQKDFLRMAGLLDEEFPRIPENRPFSPEKSTSQSRKERQKRREESHNHAKNKNGHTKHTKPAEPLFTHQPVRRTSVGGTPAYAKHSEAHLKALELEKQQAIERNKEKERLAKLGKNFDITDSEGVRYVYDYRGFKVPEEQFQRQLEEIEREKKRKSQEKKVPPHGVELIEKTRRFVEDLRKRVELVSFLYATVLVAIRVLIAIFFAHLFIGDGYRLPMVSWKVPGQYHPAAQSLGWAQSARWHCAGRQPAGQDAAIALPQRRGAGAAAQPRLPVARVPRYGGRRRGADRGALLPLPRARAHHPPQGGAVLPSASPYP